MAFPIIAPFIPLLKVLALGSIKFVFIVVGSIVAPILTFRALAYGTTPTNIKKVKFLSENNLLDEGDAAVTVATLEKVLQIAKGKGKGRRLSRVQARLFLKKVQIALLASMKEALIALWRRILAAPQHFRELDARRSRQKWILWRKWTWGRGFIRWKKDTALWADDLFLRKLRFVWKKISPFGRE